MTTVQVPASRYLRSSDRQELCAAFNGQPLSALPTPALVLDRAVIKRNSQRMADIAKAWEVDLRVHIKTHKTAEGTRSMLAPTKGPGRIIVSTLAEAWGVVDAGLVREGVVEDVLYGLPVGPHKLAELHALRLQVQSQSPSEKATVRLLVDHEDQLRALEDFANHQAGPQQPWSVMIKIENGG